MFDNQKDALRHALASRPRGMKPGDSVCYNDRTFTVLAIQQWGFNNYKAAVGLVWSGSCAHCGSVWYQLSETRVQVLHEECPKCDLAGVYGPVTLDAVVAQNLLQRGGVPAPVEHPQPKEERYGAVEQHVIKFIATECNQINGDCASAFARRCADTLPPPASGKRDQRSFLVKRAMQSLAQRKDPHIMLEHGHVIFCK